MQISLDSMRTWLIGKSNKSTYVKSLLAVVLIFGLTILLSILFYPRVFSFLSTQVSSLGALRLYSPGYYIFTIGFISIGILLVPHGLFLYRCLKPDLGLLGNTSIFFLFLASIGISLVGVFPTDISYAAHLTGAIMAFGGIVLGMIFIIFPFAKRIRRDEDWPSISLIILLFSPLIITAILTAIIIGIPVGTQILNGLELDEPEIWALFEWLLVFFSMYWFFGIIFTCKELEKFAN